MKKALIAYGLILIIPAIMSMVYSDQQEKIYTIRLTPEQADLLINVIDESQDHQKVKKIMSVIWPQLSSQLKDSADAKIPQNTPAAPKK